MIILKEKVYVLLRQIPKGKVTTYKELGRILGTKAYRYIGQILKGNPDAPHTPCHRVVCSNGTIGGYMGQTSGREIKKKIALLSQEGVYYSRGKIENFTKIIFIFK